MAHFHASLTCLSRSKGHSAVAAAAYRNGLRAVDERTGVMHDFTRRRVVTFSRVFVPPGVFLLERFEYWNQAEAAEQRRNSTVARDLVLSLPFELPHHARVEVIESISKWLTNRYQCLVDAVLHDPSHSNDPRNYHAHLLMSTRRITNLGFSKKCRELDDRKSGPNEIRAIREKWCDLVNLQLEVHKIADRIDHRSHRNRGLQELPTIRHGRGPDAKRKKAYNRTVLSLNQQLLQSLADVDQSKLVSHSSWAKEIDDSNQFGVERERPH